MNFENLAKFRTGNLVKASLKQYSFMINFTPEYDSGHFGKYDN